MSIGSLTKTSYLQSAWHPLGTAHRGYSEHALVTWALALCHPDFFPVDDSSLMRILSRTADIFSSSVLPDAVALMHQISDELEERAWWSTEDSGYLLHLQYSGTQTARTYDIVW